GVGLGEFAEETPGPVHIAIARTRPDEGGRHSVGGHPDRVAFELRAVVFGVEVAAATPGLVADAPIAHAETFGFAVGRALRPQGGGIRRGVAVLHPAPEFLCREAAHVGGKIGLGAHLFAEPGELHGAESVRIIALRTVAARAFRPFPGLYPEVGTLGAFVARTGAVAPIVLVGKAAAGPANHARLDAPKGIHQLFAKPANVGDARVFAHPDAVVHHAAQIFDEVPIDLRRDRADGFIEQNVDARLGRLRRHARD